MTVSVFVDGLPGFFERGQHNDALFQANSCVIRKSEGCVAGSFAAETKCAIESPLNLPGFAE
jgi:hypothetical protein